ncbi:MAG: hypothetical protein WBG50_09735 [Desulfomonilaceae bacterium]
MKQIRQIVYLDEYKLSSLSSQLFGGLTEFFIRYRQAAGIEREEQKGPFASGKLVGHVDTQAAGQEERLVLYDHECALFEEELKKQGAIIECDLSSCPEAIEKISSGSFIKVKGWPDFYDMQAIGEVLQNHNEFGKAIAYLSTYEQRKADARLLEGKTKGKKKIEKQKLEEIARQLGFDFFDPEFITKLGMILDYGYGGHFEVQIRPYGDDPKKPFFSALLKRQHLREDEKLVVKKFSRRALEPFCLIGIVCQGTIKIERPKAQPSTSTDAPGSIESTNSADFRDTLKGMVSAVAEMEKAFMGRRSNEVVIDPIALYREINISSKEPISK